MQFINGSCCCSRVYLGVLAMRRSQVDLGILAMRRSRVDLGGLATRVIKQTCILLVNYEPIQISNEYNNRCIQEGWGGGLSQNGHNFR